MAKKIGVFGGSFNPIHNGHLIAANEILRKKLADEIWLMPCYSHPLKKKQDFASVTDRMKMISLAIKGKKNMLLSPFEIELAEIDKKRNYTIETIKALKKNYPELEFYFIIGENLLLELSKWKQIELLVKEVRFIVYPMHSDNISKIKENKYVKQNNSIILQDCITTNISSSEIRKRIKNKEIIDLLVPEKVKKYIEKKKLYQ